MVCVRRAWLVMGPRSLELEDDTASYACTELDLGFPEVRDSPVSPRPDRDGTDDRTRLMGSRPISANITADESGWMTPDEIATLFAPYMVPSARPVLHYVLDRPGTPERFVTVRAADYGWPITGGRTRDIHLAWVAPDPVMRDPAAREAVSHSGSSTVGGRTYDLAYDRTYVAGAGAPTTGVIESPGDVAVRPVVDIFGPITDPVVTFQVQDPPPAVVRTFALRFVAGFRIDPGRWIRVDTDARTAADDTGANIMGSLDWAGTQWPVLPTAPASTYMSLAGTTTTGVTQAVAMWTDGSLT